MTDTKTARKARRIIRRCVRILRIENTALAHKAASRWQRKARGLKR